MTNNDALEAAIAEFENSFWDLDQIHAFAIRLDAFSSAVEAHLEAAQPGSTKDIYSHIALLRCAKVGERAIELILELCRLADSVDYDESLLDSSDVGKANDHLQELYKELRQWFQQTTSSN